MPKFLKLFFVSLLIFVAIDLTWMLLIARTLYEAQIADILTAQPNLIIAGIFYLIFTLGLTYFVIVPALEKKSINLAVLTGAFFGLVCYATYSLANLSYITNWSYLVAFVDIAWGAFVCSITASISYLIFQNRV
ncbi:MAG: DUF2177 family protein [Clostridia bacterium]|nr:DUF2177 family protein [Clostridia bacterium]